jgi:hypothetical protein
MAVASNGNLRVEEMLTAGARCFDDGRECGAEKTLR